uniref:C-type lectin domain-containing protein n=1 Tax=Romanomermis culicivorax TaxID=13658 RepID=A0A915KH40_ROMCU
MFLPRPAHSFNEAENLCQKAYPGSHLMSLHSEMEHQAAYYELYTKSHPWNAHGFGVYIGIKIRIDPLPVNRSHKIVVKSPRQDVLLNSTENGTLTHKKILESRIYRKPFMPNVLLSNVNNDLLLYAAYHGSKLKEREFSKFYHSSVGNCYTFNGKSPVKKATRTGISGGLKLELTFNSSNISTPGLLLMLTSPTETISPNSSSYKISTAFQTDVALSAVTPCYMLYDVHFTYSKCITDTKLAVSKRRYHKCLCRQPCKTISYRKVLSLSRLIAKHNRGIPINQRAVVNVYFISLNVDSYEAHLSYTFSMMVTNIAQIITLFLGFSIMSLIEICQWFLHFVWH